MSFIPVSSKIFDLRTFTKSKQPIAPPEPGYVLIKVQTAVLHPDGDGIEGIGIVIKSGVTSWRLEKARVNYIQTDKRFQGFISNYVVCLAKTCVISRTPGVHFYNPLTVIMLKEAICSGGHKNVIHTSNDKIINEMLHKICGFLGINLVNTGDYIVEGAIEEIKPSILLVGDSELDLSLFNSFPEGSEMVVYREVNEISGISPSEIIFKGKKIRGLNFSKWFDGLSMKHRYEYLHFIEDHSEIFRQEAKNIYLTEIMAGADLLRERRQVEIRELFFDNIDNNDEEASFDPAEAVESGLNSKPYTREEHKSSENPDLGIFGTTVSYSTSSYEEIKQQGDCSIPDCSKNLSVNMLIIDDTISSEEVLNDTSTRLADANAESKVDPRTNPEYQPLYEIISQCENPRVAQAFAELPVINQDEFEIEDEVVLSYTVKLLPDHSVYEGQVNQYGQLHGFGKRHYSDGSLYFGLWEFGQASVYGHYVSSELEVYIGEWAVGLCHGNGRLQKANGDVLEGVFHKGKLEGKGSEVKQFEKYTGEFQDGVRHGHGTILWNDNVEYCGEFKNGVMFGEGKVTYPTKVFTGIFEGHEATGEMLYADGSKFIGSITNLVEEGEGEYEANGTKRKCVMTHGELRFLEEIHKKSSENSEDSDDSDDKSSKKSSDD